MAASEPAGRRAPGRERGGFLAWLERVHWGRHTDQRQPHPEKETRGPRRRDASGRRGPSGHPSPPPGGLLSPGQGGAGSPRAHNPRSARTALTPQPRGAAAKGGPEAPGSGGVGTAHRAREGVTAAPLQGQRP